MIGQTISHYKVLEKIGKEAWEVSQEPALVRLWMRALLLFITIFSRFLFSFELYPVSESGTDKDRELRDS